MALLCLKCKPSILKRTKKGLAWSGSLNASAHHRQLLLSECKLHLARLSTSAAMSSKRYE